MAPILMAPHLLHRTRKWGTQEEVLLSLMATLSEPTTDHPGCYHTPSYTRTTWGNLDCLSIHLSGQDRSLPTGRTRGHYPVSLWAYPVSLLSSGNRNSLNGSTQNSSEFWDLRIYFNKGVHTHVHTNRRVKVETLNKNWWWYPASWSTTENYLRIQPIPLRIIWELWLPTGVSFKPSVPSPLHLSSLRDGVVILLDTGPGWEPVWQKKKKKHSLPLLRTHAPGLH